MTGLTKVVERKIASLLPDFFSMKLDGWAEIGLHYIDIYASFHKINSFGFEKSLLAFSPMRDESTKG